MTTSSYKEKIKKELFEKIQKHNELLAERDKREAEADEDGISIAELCEDSDEHAGLCSQILDLQDAIDEDMIDTKYAPLVSLSHDEIKRFDFHIKSSDLSLEQDKVIEKHLDFKLKKFTGEIKNRLRKIKTLRLPAAPFDQRAYCLYGEVVSCFIYGVFQASCALCRAVAEFMVEEYMIRKGQGEALRQAKKWEKRKVLAEFIRKTEELRQVERAYSEIGDKANRTLHDKSIGVEEKNVLDTIKTLHFFIEKFPQARQK